MRTRRLLRPMLLVSLLLALTPLGPAAGPASASCVGPTLNLDQDEIVGPTLEVIGIAFVNGCEDTMTCGPGCSTRCTYDDPETPMTAVALTLRQSGRSWVLDESDADPDGRGSCSPRRSRPARGRGGRCWSPAGRYGRWCGWTRDGT